MCFQYLNLIHELYIYPSFINQPYQPVNISNLTKIPFPHLSSFCNKQSSPCQAGEVPSPCIRVCVCVRARARSCVCARVRARACVIVKAPDRAKFPGPKKEHWQAGLPLAFVINLFRRQFFAKTSTPQLSILGYRLDQSVLNENLRQAVQMLCLHLSTA